MDYHKRHFTRRNFFPLSIDFLAHVGDLWRAAAGKRLSRAFAEEIMLSVTQVNDCRYCRFAHTRLALKAGIPEEDLLKILQGSLGQSPQERVQALAFARHYAESGGRPQAGAWRSLVAFYGQETARDILATTRAIHYANLLGNTFDRLFYR